MTQDQALELFEKTGALLKGHFILRSGLHSREFFQCALALQEMPIVEQLGAGLADRLRGLGARTVLAPAMGGLVIGQEVARQLGLRFIFVEKEAGELLIVEDVVTKGGRVAETLAIARAHQADVRGIGLLVDRSNGSVDFGVPFHPLIRMKVETFEPDQLPDDLRSSQAVKPGSK
ncbi:MAG: orotate phosphoribosyltransferase [Verrucomicrobia bacterium]|nr:orotate phosphoribosyltransferase [Verrucomicrobiota bacterium]